MAQTPRADLPGGGRIPLLGFGTWQLSGTEAYDAVGTALEVGYRHLDTATMYRNEREVGRALRDSGVARSDVFVTTKLPPERAGRARQTLEESLAALGLERVDLWLVHWPPGGAASPATWQEMLAAQADGLAADVGVSNYSTAQIDELLAATGVGPAVDQVRWSPAVHDRRQAEDLRERGVVLEGYSPFRASDLDDPTLQEVAGEVGVSVPQVILRWHLQHGFVAIPRSARPERIAANADLLDFALDDEQMRRLDALGGAG